MMKSAIAFTALAFVALVGLMGSSQKPKNPPPADPVPTTHHLIDLEAPQDPRLGVSFAQSLDGLAEAGMSKARITALWSQREPKRGGDYQWGGMDRRVRAIQAAGMDPVVTFATDTFGLASDCPGKQPNMVPDDMDHMKAWVAATVERYDYDGLDDMDGLKRPVRLWQGPNEWTNGGCRNGGWAGTPEQFIAVNNAEYAAVHGADPDAVFILGGISSGTLDKLAAMAPTDRKRTGFENIVSLCRFDMVDAHLYGPWTTIPRRVGYLRTVARGMPICSTEAGGPLASDYTPAGHFEAVLGINLTAIAEGVDFVLWFRSNDGGDPTPGNSMTALSERDGTPKPGLYAYHLLANLLVGAGSVSGDGPWVIDYRDGTSRTVSIDGEIRVTNPEMVVTDPVAGVYE